MSTFEVGEKIWFVHPDRKEPVEGTIYDKSVDNSYGINMGGLQQTWRLAVDIYKTKEEALAYRPAYLAILDAQQTTILKRNRKKDVGELVAKAIDPDTYNRQYDMAMEAFDDALQPCNLRINPIADALPRIKLTLGGRRKKTKRARRRRRTRKN